MMMTIPSAPGGAAAADSALPGVANGGALPAPADAEGAADGALPALFAQLLDMAGLALPADGAAAPAAPQGAADETAKDKDAPADAALAAMLPVLNLAVLPVVQSESAPVASAPATDAPRADAIAVPAPAAAPNGAAAAAAQLRQAAADALTAATTAAAVTPAALPPHLLRGAALPVAGDLAARQPGADQRPASSAVASNGSAAAPATAAAPAAVLAASSDSTGQSSQDGQSGNGQPDHTSFRGVMAAGAPAATQPATASAETVKLAGSADQWQQPLRAALGDRLQLQLQKGSDHAVIRLDPPNLGSIEISIRQTAGSLQVNLTATHNEVLRQLNAVGDSMRNDLSQRQYGDVAVTVSPSSQRSLADSDGRGRQPERDQQQRAPGRALNEGDETSTTFAMLRE